MSYQHQALASSATELVSAAHALARHKLVDAYGHVSIRAGSTVLVTPPRPLSEAAVGDLIHVPLDTDTLPTGTPPEAWAHLAIYRSRTDVAAVARAMPPSGFAASTTAAAIPVLHGQTSWLGDNVPVHPSARLLRSIDLANDMADSMGTAHAVLLRGNGALTVGETPGVAMARMHLLEAACRVWLQASSIGTPQPLTPDEIAGWQQTSPQLLPRLWEFLSAS